MAPPPLPLTSSLASILIIVVFVVNLEIPDHPLQKKSGFIWCNYISVMLRLFKCFWETFFDLLDLQNPEKKKINKSIQNRGVLLTTYKQVDLFTICLIVFLGLNWYKF